jgi:tRNA (guanine37-N1)-methyltransferase
MERLCVKVKKRFGEPVRQALAEMDLLDNSYRLSADDDCLYVPVVDDCPEDVCLNLPPGAEITKHDLQPNKKQLTPESLLGYSPSFEIVGDIAILDGDEEEPETVARALLEFRKSLHVVLQEESGITGEFRVRRFRLVAGEDRTETVHRDHGCRYLVDIAKAYFTPRLSTERQRVVLQLKPKDVVVDMFAGVGPYSIAAAKKCGYVYAIDKNPQAVEYLLKNIELNRLDNVEAFVADARDLPRMLGAVADHVIMNLPHNACDFVNEAVALTKPGGVIHYYAMAHEDDLFGPSLCLIEEAVKKAGREFEVMVTRSVRSYAPHQYNICIDMRID